MLALGYGAWVRSQQQPLQNLYLCIMTYETYSILPSLSWMQETDRHPGAPTTSHG